ncbi:MAG TPA: tyrosine-type recombinase/integrase [Tepidisphaeraceae bacterium]|jgi:integrase|nr:tyrosine-type recombinase/integrase [Tepidisphaeraceae bacterium]
MRGKRSSFRIGKVRGYLRGRIWYLCYHENGQRRRPRIGPELEAARKLAAHTNAQLESSTATLLNFEPVTVVELRGRWLTHHEQVLRSSVHTIDRYRTATDHLLSFLGDRRGGKLASQFTAADAQAFAAHLREIEVAPNGHKNSAKRRLLDKGIKYILETSRALFNYAAKRRHLSAYAPNPFSEIQIDRMPIEEAKPIVLFSREQERQFFEACDDWQFPIFMTLALTGLRPGELVHLVLPEDLDLDQGILRVRNKPQLGWQVKTRNQRDVPLLAPLANVLTAHLRGRRCGPVFLRRLVQATQSEPLKEISTEDLKSEVTARVGAREAELARSLSRKERLAVTGSVWWDAGALKEDRIRTEFMSVTRKIGIPSATAPKLWRHQFATALQDANVDPLIRNHLMGHCPVNGSGYGTALGMTALYTHTNPKTARTQLEEAIRAHPAIAAAPLWLVRHQASGC